ncbi:hypothetical protein [Nonomuraea sediminis]|uniref:hypothetical protein n=1 Tax=Nonomuraea sediminis TaxID=2835864 RepID=UPI001BDC7EAC|nr:hypothetical protein [Nonomuraea sediminis]
MSRHIIPNPPGSPLRRVTSVGWDRPLATFFAMSFDPPAPGDEFDNEIEVFWIGATPCEIPTVEALAHTLAEHHVELPGDIKRLLAVEAKVEGQGFAGRPATSVIAAAVRPHVPADQQARIDAALEGGVG